MNLVIRFLIWCARWAPPRVIEGRNGESAYLTRYFIFRRSPLTEGMDRHALKVPRWGLYLHCFHRGDVDGACHDHPWDWAISFVLKNGYSEERRVGDKVIRRDIRPYRFNFLRGDTFHRVDLVRGEAWTLFLVGPIVKSWGFWDRDTGIVTPWRVFLGCESEEENY